MSYDLLKDNGKLLELVKEEELNQERRNFKIVRAWLQHAIGHDILDFANDIMTHAKIRGAVGPTKDVTLNALDIGKIRDAVERLATIGEMLRNIGARDYCPIEGYWSENSIECPKCGDAAIDISKRWGSRESFSLSDVLSGKCVEPEHRKMFACHNCQWFWERKTKGGPVTEVDYEVRELTQDAEWRDQEQPIAEPLSDEELKRRAELADEVNDAMFGEKR